MNIKTLKAIRKRVHLRRQSDIRALLDYVDELLPYKEKTDKLQEELKASRTVDRTLLKELDNLERKVVRLEQETNYGARLSDENLKIIGSLVDQILTLEAELSFTRVATGEQSVAYLMIDGKPRTYSPK